MDIALSTAWWIACGILVAVELATGTFYLLMLALGCVAGAAAAHLGLGLPAQLIAAAVVGGGAVALWHRKRGARPSTLPVEANPDVNIDVGQAVDVEQWNDDALTASVRYRGAVWRARYVGPGAPAAGRHVIRALDGSCLLLDR